MKRLLTAFACVAILALGTASCKIITYKGEIRVHDGKDSVTASGEVSTRSYSCADFTGISASGSMTVNYVPGDYGVEITTYDNIFDYIEVYVNNDSCLVVGFKDSTIKNCDILEVNVSCPGLDMVSLSGAVDMNMPEGLDAGDFRLMMSGASQFVADGFVSAGNISFDVNGAGKATFASVKAKEFEAEFDGAGELNLNDVDCGNIDLQVSGTGKAYLAGRAGSTTVSISGAGNVDARNLECADFNSRVSGIAKIRRP